MTQVNSSLTNKSIKIFCDNGYILFRYDCRGHLYNEADFNFENNVPEPLSQEDEALERELDKERYIDLQEDQIRKSMLEGIFLYFCIYVTRSLTR